MHGPDYRDLRAERGVQEVLLQLEWLHPGLTLRVVCGWCGGELELRPSLPRRLQTAQFPHRRHPWAMDSGSAAWC
jgi:hypothetical protein